MRLLVFFYEALILICDQIRNDSFTYESDAKLRSYLKTTCLHKGRNYKRKMSGSRFIVSTEQIESMGSDYGSSLEAEQEDAYQKKKELYGIDLSQVVSNEKIIPPKMIGGFP